MLKNIQTLFIPQMMKRLNINGKRNISTVILIRWIDIPNITPSLKILLGFITKKLSFLGKEVRHI